MTNLVKKFRGNENSAPVEPAVSDAVCVRTPQSGPDIGVAIKVNSENTVLLRADGTLPDLKTGDTDLPISKASFSGADSSKSILDLGSAGNDVLAVQGQWGDERILAFAGTSTRKEALKGNSVFDYQGQAYLEYKPANQSSIEVAASAQLTIDPNTQWVQLSIVNSGNSKMPFEKLEWMQIAYCDGQFQSTGEGRYKLIAASGRMTNLIGLSADGPSGTAILSGWLYGQEPSMSAVIGFTLTGVTGTLIGIVSMPEGAE